MSSLVDIFTDLFGTYQPIITDIIVNEQSQQVVSVNWEYIFTVLIFILILNSTLRILGGIICGR